MDIQEGVCAVGAAARKAAGVVCGSDTDTRNQALHRIGDSLDASRQQLRQANEQDLLVAADLGLDAALLDRLTLTEGRIDAMIQGLLQVADLPDPVGEITDLSYRPSGIQVGRMRVPLGVVGIIYESRPNVTVDAAALCLKSGNAAILRGGREAIHSNQALVQCVQRGLQTVGLPAEAVQLIETTHRAAVGYMLQLDEYIDVIIPRGGRGLIERILAESRIPVIKHLDGICHVYIDRDACPDKAKAIAFNAKAQRYGVCNAMETLLVARDMAEKVLPGLIEQYLQAGIALRGCESTRAFSQSVVPASEEDWQTEYLGPVLSIRIVEDVDQAIAHINLYGSRHTDSIVTENYTVGRRFLREVDSSSVMINASTRFADGFQYGLGAEVGISTDKLHARGPVGLNGLTSRKFVVFGDGQIVE